MSDNSGTDARGRRRSRTLSWIALALAAIGALTSVELTRLHYVVHTDPTHQSWCRVDETVNCEAVERSTEAVFLAVPVAVWGLLGYLVLLGVAISGLLTRRSTTWPGGALLLIGLIFSAVSVYNAYISFAVLGAVCLLCVATYVFNLLLLASAFGSAIRSDRDLTRVVVADLRLLLQRWPQSAAAAMCFGLTAAALMLLYPSYWDREGAAALPDPSQLNSGRTDTGAPWLGAANPVVTLIEYSDYECPFCSRSHAVVRRALAEAPDRLRLVHRHFPLDMDCNDMLDRPFHHHACLAARAAVCADAEGKFWQMNDALFAAQQELGRERVDEIANRLGLDQIRFDGCMLIERTDDVIQEDIEAAERLQATGTPLYVINGEVHRGAMTPERLDQILGALDREP